MENTRNSPEKHVKWVLNQEYTRKTQEITGNYLEITRNSHQKLGVVWSTAIGILSEDKHVSGSQPFLASGTCKREDGDEHAQLMSTVIEACNAETSLIGCPLFCVAYDGESCRGSALTQLTHKAPLNPCSELYGLLGNLWLLNLLMGDNN